ncbi:MAG: hypothetical protein P8Z75_10090 [Gammaproteobacteria bacterium]|jgi:hypothetical protein
MKYRIESNESGLDIKISEANDKQKLMQAFQECQEGRCSCPTQEYTKLGSLEIENDENLIYLKLRAKSNEQFDEAEISKCLEYTRGQVEGDQ